MLLATVADLGTSTENSEVGLREQLKLATSAAHRALDERLSGFDLTRLDGYRRFLEANAAALLPLEAALERSDVARIFPDWPRRSRRDAILADMRRLGGVARPLGDVAPLGRNGILGVMYVLEGSRLGAKYLMRTVAGRGKGDVAAATAYLSHGANASLWPTFLSKLETEPVTPADTAEITAAAHSAFAMFLEAAARA